VFHLPRNWRRKGTPTEHGRILAALVISVAQGFDELASSEHDSAHFKKHQSSSFTKGCHE
jgi:hypothetical protein